MTWQTVLDTVLDDLEVQAGIIITPQQLNTLQRTHELRFKTTDLKPYNVAGIRQYLYNTSAKRWSPVNKIDNLNRDFFVLCHD